MSYIEPTCTRITSLLCMRHSWIIYFLKVNDIWARGYKTFSMLNLAEHEISNSPKYKKYQEIQHF